MSTYVRIFHDWDFVTMNALLFRKSWEIQDVNKKRITNFNFLWNKKSLTISFVRLLKFGCICHLACLTEWFEKKNMMEERKSTSTSYFDWKNEKAMCLFSNFHFELHSILSYRGFVSNESVRCAKLRFFTILHTF